MTIKLILAVLLLFPIPVTVIAQYDQGNRQGDGVISGWVYDAESMEPVASANVFLDSLFISTTTTTDGRFEILHVPPATYRLVARRIGYKTYVEENLRISSSELISRSIMLQPAELKAEEIIVTATRREQTAQMAPASVAILNINDLRNRSIVTFDQALEMVPGISVHRSAGISVQSLSIRGSSDVAGGGIGNRVLLMIDGRPALASDSGGALWSLVPINFIDRVEVVKGAFSSLYGSTAMGGVINVITRHPTYSSVTTVDIGYGFYQKPHTSLRHTDRTAWQSQFDLSHSGNRESIGYLISLSRKQSDGYSENSAYEFYSVFGKVLYDFNRVRNLELSFGASLAENDYPHTWLSNLQPLRVLPKYRDDRQKKINYSVDLLYRAVPGARVKYSSRFYFYRKAARSYFNRDDPLLSIPGNEPYGLKTVIDADKFGNITQLDYYLNERNYLISGLDVQIDHVNSSPDTIMFGNHQVDNIALYIQDEAELIPGLKATLGLRYDWNHLAGGSTLGQISPKLALVYSPQEYIAFRTLLGQAFRAPSIAERFFRQELGGGTLFKPNPGLKAERMDFSLETGMRWRLNDFAEVDIAYFHYHYRDLIYWVEISAEEGVTYTLFQVRNLNRALMKGVETEINLRWKPYFSTSLSYVYLNAKDRSENRLDDLLAYRMRHLLFFSMDGHIGRFTLNLNGRYRSKVDEVFLYPLEAPDAFVVVNMKASIHLGKLLHLWTAVNNLFDKQYEELARYRMPGRNWIFGTSIQF